MLRRTKKQLVRTYLAKGYEFFGDHEKAARQYKIAAEKTPEPEQKLRRYTQAAIQFARADEKEEVKTAIQSAMRFVADAEDGDVILTKTLLEIADLAKDQDLFLGLSERLVQLLPGDTDARFRLAYRYSEIDRNELALLHYLKIPYEERSDMTWNNLGVAFDQLELPSKSVKSYRIAESKNNTLSMSNLAQKLIRAGFLDEAGQLCDTAVKIVDYHKNIGDAIARIRDIHSEEDKKEEELLAKVNPITNYYRDYGTAAAKTDISEIEGVWSGLRCPLKVQIKNGHFTATGTYEQSPYLNALAVALGGQSAVPPSKPPKYGVEYEGTVTGLAVRGTVSIEEVKSIATIPSLLDSGKNSKDVLMVISDDKKEIRVWEKGEKDVGKFYSLTSKQSWN